MANKPGEANFFPDVPEFPSMGAFQPIYGKFDLTTYIQGASDYEIMAFLVGKYNACLEAYGTVTKLSADTVTACKQLQDWINTWFTNLNVQEELNNKIDSMVQDGSFATLLHQTFDVQLNQQVINTTTAWLIANVTPSGSAVIVDKSLTIEGAAADAKATGERYHYISHLHSGSTFDFNTVNKMNTIDAIYSASEVTNAPFDNWKDGSTWFVENHFDSITPSYIIQLIYKPCSYTSMSAYRIYDTYTEKWSGWTIYTGSTAFYSHLNPASTFDFNTADMGNTVNAIYSATQVTNAPFDNWKDGSTWFVETKWDAASPQYLTQYVYKPGSSIDAGAARTYDTFSKTWSNWSIHPATSTNVAGETIECGPGKTYETLRSACEYAITKANTTVIVYPGTYNLATEFADHISAKNGSGISLNNGIHVIFLGGAYVKAIFDNTNRWVYENFEPFRAVGSFTLEGLNIESANCRYCVHDEHYGNGTYHNKYINCTMKYTNTHTDVTYVQCIGGGLGEHGFIEITGGMYTSITTAAPSGETIDELTLPITYHNGNNANADNKIFISNVLLTDKGHFRFGDYGPSTIKSQVIINNCKMGLPTVHTFENSEFSTVNFEITEFNNVIE